MSETPRAGYLPGDSFSSEHGGTVTILGGGTIHYEAPQGFIGTDSFPQAVWCDRVICTVWVPARKAPKRNRALPTAKTRRKWRRG